jgi:methylglutaconyl-CoA hydratase
VENLVTKETRGGAAILALNRPDKRNALSRALISSLSEAFLWARDASAVRCVILSGAGSTFCAGMDLAELAETIDSQEGGAEPDRIWEDALRLAYLYDLIYTFPKPTIAAVNGAAVAGGAGLVTVCDLAVAVPEARFGYPEVRRGLVAAMVMPHLLRLVGERTARYLLLSGELIDAQEAVRTGFINAITADGRVLDQSLNWANSLCQGGPEALARTKDLLRQLSRQALSVEEAAQASAAPRLSAECRIGLKAFFDKKPAPWTIDKG